jgi:5-methylcytosine-specific restriction endonuclease McrA
MTATKRAAKIRKIIEHDGPGCFYCGCRLTVRAKQHSGRNRTLDHRLPKSKGGTNHTENLRVVCYNCNKRKRDRTEENFLTLAWVELRRLQVEREDALGVR